MRGFLDAAGFLTRVPVPTRELDDRQLARAVAWFPMVGGAIGLAVAGAYAAAHLVLPALAAAAVAVAAGVVVTGGFHEDGLADAADAAGGWTVADRRRILDDPRHGTYGVLALVLSVTVRTAALAALAPASAAGALVAAHALGRAAAVGLMAAGPIPARGLGASYARHLRAHHTVVAVTSGVVLGAAGLRCWGPAAAVLAAAVALAFRRWARRALDGVTGDVLGACEQVSEAAVLLLAAGAAGT